MQKCKLCDNDIYNGGILHYLFSDDNLCFKCRSSLVYKPIHIKLDQYKIYSLYLYNDAFQSLIIQYKECYDEYLYDTFLYKYKFSLWLRYYGYKVVLVPSSNEKLSQRGFNHLYKIFKELNLEIIDILYKKQDVELKKLNFKNRKIESDLFGIKDDVVLPDKILLVDDIITSGSSIIACANLLKNAKKVKILTISYNKIYEKK